MATVTRENIGLLNDKITVKVNKEDYLSSFEKSLKNYSKSANIPGFRKGMVPTGMIRKMHGQSVFTEEVLRSIEKELTQYMTSEKLEIFGQPLPLPENDARQIDLNNPVEYTFEFEVGLKPSFELVDLSQQHPPLYKVQVTDEMVNEEVERLQLRHGKMTDPEEVTGDDNVLNVTFVETDGAGNEVAEGLRKDNSLLVKYFAESFRPQLIGKKNNDVVEVKLDEAFEGKEKSWVLEDLGLSEEEAAQKQFNMHITKVGLVEKAGFEDSFYKAAFPNKDIQSEEDFRNTVKEEIASQFDHQAKHHLQHELYHILLEKTDIELPAEFLKRWIQFNGEKQKSAEEAEQEYPHFKNQLKWSLITDRIIRDENIDVQADELKEFAKNQLFSYMGMSNFGDDQQWINDYVNKMMQDKKFFEDAYFRIQTDKVFQWAETKVQPEEKQVSVEEFNKVLQAHQHEH